MVKINYKELKFDHIVVFNQEDTIFACGRQNANGRIRLFLVFGNGNGRVYTRNGLAESWEVLEGQGAKTIRQQIKQATKEGIAVYQFNGTSQITYPNHVAA
jgi:hypothetical protein